MIVWTLPGVVVSHLQPLAASTPNGGITCNFLGIWHIHCYKKQYTEINQFVMNIMLCTGKMNIILD